MANTDDLAQRIEHLRSEGYCILENVIPSDEVDALRDSVLATADSEAYNESRDFIGNNRDFPRYVGSERVLGLVDSMLGRFARIAFTGPIIRQSRDKRGSWHSDWPFGAGGAAYIPEPYPDVVAYMTSIWMLTPFSAETGGTLIIPRSHTWRIDPLGGNGPAANESHPDEIHVTGNPGSVMIFDSRMWHAKPNNDAGTRRVAVRVCFAPWWLNLDVLDPNSADGQRMASVAGAGRATASPAMPKIPREAFESFPENVKPLYYHWVRR